MLWISLEIGKTKKPHAHRGYLMRKKRKICLNVPRELRRNDLRNWAEAAGCVEADAGNRGEPDENARGQSTLLEKTTKATVTPVQSPSSHPTTLALDVITMHQKEGGRNQGSI